MKITLFAMALAILTSCSSKETKQDKMRIAKENVESYLKQKLKIGDGIIIDSLHVIDIDTLNEKQSLILKGNWLYSEYERQVEIATNEDDLLKSYKGLNMDDYIIEDQQRKLSKAIDDFSETKAKYDDVSKKIEKAKSKQYRYHFIKGTLYFRENGAAKTMDVAIPANEALQAVETKDIK